MCKFKKIFCFVFSHHWEGCICRTCGKTRDYGHVFEGCQCVICEKIRNTSHEYSETGCKICGSITPAGLNLQEYRKCALSGHEFVNHNSTSHICAKCGLIEDHQFYTEENDTGAWNTDYPGLEVYEITTGCTLCNFKETAYRSNYPDYPYV